MYIFIIFHINFACRESFMKWLWGHFFIDFKLKDYKYIKVNPMKCKVDKILLKIWHCFREQKFIAVVLRSSLLWESD